MGKIGSRSFSFSRVTRDSFCWSANGHGDLGLAHGQLGDGLHESVTILEQ
jgi:hypothetical protein